MNLVTYVSAKSDIGPSQEGGPEIEQKIILLGTATAKVMVDPVVNTCQGVVSFLQIGTTAPVQSSFSCAVTRDTLRPLNNMIFVAKGVSDKAVYAGTNGLHSDLYLGIQGLKWTTGLHQVIFPQQPTIPDFYNVTLAVAGFNGNATGSFSFGIKSDGSALDCK